MYQYNLWPEYRLYANFGNGLQEISICEVAFHPLVEGAAPPIEDLVDGLHTRLVDVGFARVSKDHLRTLDLEGGIKRAFRDAVASYQHAC